MQISLFSLHTSMKAPIGNLSFQTTGIGWIILFKFNWHWFPMQTRFPFCFFEHLQYLLYNYLAPLWWQMDSIPENTIIKMEQTNETKADLKFSSRMCYIGGNWSQKFWFEGSNKRLLLNIYLGINVRSGAQLYWGLGGLQYFLTNLCMFYIISLP